MIEPGTVYIATSRPDEIGLRCQCFAKSNTFGWRITEDIEECEVFISVLYDTLLTPKFINEEGRRCYNFHPGILPSYRGSGAYSWSLLNGEKETGVTLHEIDEDIDSGPIIDVRTTMIGDRDTAESLFQKSMDKLYTMFVDWYSRLLLEEYKTYPNEGGTLYLRKELESQKDISNIVKAFTFKGKESAYWYDSTGKKRYVEWE